MRRPAPPRASEPTGEPTVGTSPSPVPTLAFDELSYSYIYDTIAPTPLPTGEPSPSPTLTPWAPP